MLVYTNTGVSNQFQYNNTRPAVMQDIKNLHTFSTCSELFALCSLIFKITNFII